MSHGQSVEEVRVGILYPGYAAEDDYPRMADILRGVHVEVVHTSVGEDAHRVDALLDIGSSERLIEGAQELKRRGGVDAAIWACTSGSFVFGPEGAERQAGEIEEFLGVPASSTSIAFVEAVRSLGMRRVAVAATYPEDVVQAFADYLGAAGIEAVSLGSQGIVTAAEVGTLGRERVMAFVAGGDHPDAEAVLVPDTALHTVAWLPDLEGALGKPVLTANQVTMWQGLRLAGRPLRAEGLGRLFGGEGITAPGA